MAEQESNPPAEPSQAESKQELVSGLAALEVLNAVPGPTTNIPETTLSTPMVHIPAEPIEMIAEALQESADKKPNWWTILVAIASPLALMGKSIEDAYRAIVAASKGTELTFMNLGVPIFTLVIGITGAVTIGVNLAGGTKSTRLQKLAKAQVQRWLKELGSNWSA